MESMPAATPSKANGIPLTGRCWSRRGTTSALPYRGQRMRACLTQGGRRAD